MAKVKTEKYFINNYLSDGVVYNRMEVSKTVFNKQYKQVLEQYQQQEDLENEFAVEMDTLLDDKGTYFEKRVSFSWSICAIDFVTLTCKENYHFTK